MWMVFSGGGDCRRAVVGCEPDRSGPLGGSVPCLCGEGRPGPAGATKATHGRIRDMCKACVLGVQYGMRAKTLAYRTGTTTEEANLLLRARWR